MHAPDHWYPAAGGGTAAQRLAALALSPLGALYDLAGRIRFALAKPYRASVPVLCIGNATAGGTGKTPLTIAIAHGLKALGHRPFIVTRGYRGRLAGPIAVNLSRHDAADVGDEPLLLAAAAPTIVAKSRAAGVSQAAAAGANIVLLDDGLQNPSVAKKLSLLVVDGELGFGNGRVIPAGPLRERLSRAFAKSHAVVAMGRLSPRTTEQLKAWSGPVFHAQIEAVAPAFRPGRYLAFAGIGRPEKFFLTLESLGATLAERIALPDHHAFTRAELEGLLARAERAGARPITTAKDAARLPAEFRERIDILPVAATLAASEAFGRFLIERLALSSPIANKASTDPISGA